jgi:site-specific recombinase XerD
MARYNFYLKDKKSKKETSIILYVSYNSKFCKISTGLKILPKYWNYKKQSVKPQVAKSTEINNRLSKFLEEIENTYLSILNENIFITNDIIIDRFRNDTNPKVELDLLNFFESHISAQKQLAKSTISDYRQTLKSLTLFQKSTKYNVSFDSINLTFYDKFKCFVLDFQGYSINTFGKRIKVIKTFMKDALDRKLHNNLDFQHKDFKTTEEVKKKMYLNISDIKKLLNTEILDENLDEVRDVFLLICLLGIRVSDFHQLNKSNITKQDEGYTFNFQCQKTKNFQNIPIHIKGMDIVKKYNYSLPELDENKINKKIKKVAEICELNDEFTNTDGTFKKCEIISTKTGRISFATNAYLNTEMPKRSIMVVTGHKKESSFDRYVQAQRPPKHKEIYKVYGDLN